MPKFHEFYATWRERVRLTTTPELTSAIYFQDARDEEGFDALADFVADHGEDWAVLVAEVFEKRSALAGRLDRMALAKFRMIFDRHMLNLSYANFDAAYHQSSDERALFLIHAKVPPVRVSAGLNAARNASIDMITTRMSGKPRAHVLHVISAMSTLFMVELNHILRVYIYYAKHNSDRRSIFEVVMLGDDDAKFDYAPPTRNGQMSLASASKLGLVELF